MDKVKVKSNQSIFDIAVEHFGGIEAVIDLAFANDISLTESLETASELIGVEIVKKKRQRYSPIASISQQQQSPKI